jgi:hypothetical protein
MRPCKAILIDPVTCTVRFVEVDGDDFNSIYPQLDCQTFTACCHIARDGETGSYKDDQMLVDDEGLYVKDQRFFMIKAYPGPIAGRGLILGLDALGNTISTRLSLDVIKPMWMSHGDLSLYRKGERAHKAEMERKAEELGIGIAVITVDDVLDDASNDEGDE